MQPQPQPKPPEPVVVQPQPQPQPKPPEPVVVQPQPQPQPEPVVQPEPPRGLTAREAYTLGVEEYNRGDYAAARAHFAQAQDAGYRPPLFKDPPSKYIARIDARAPRPPVEERVTVTVPPTTGPTVVVSPADQELAAAARIEKARAEQRTYEAQQLIAKAQEAQRDNRLRDAYNYYHEARRLDPSNRVAAEGEAQTELMVGGAARTDVLDDQLKRAAVIRDAIRWNFDQAIADANAAIAARDFNKAQEALDRARVAKESNPTVFSKEDLDRFDSIVVNTQLRLAKSQEGTRVVEANQAAAEAQRDAAERARIEAVERRRTVSILVKTARQLTYDGQYTQAEGVLNQILAIDPTNDYAVGVKQLVHDNAVFQEQRRLREKHDREFDRQLNTAEEKKIPYTDIMVYPTNWPDISDLRDREVMAERRGGGEDLQPQALLDKRLPEVRFQDAPLADVVDFMRDVTGANITVNWSTIEAAGIDRKKPVTQRLRNIQGSIALKEILASVSGPAKLGYTIEDGLVKISTEEELKSKTTTEVYDIRDMLVLASDVEEPPDFGLSTSNNRNRNNGKGSRDSGGSFRTVGTQR